MMKNVVKVVDDISNVLSADKEPGDPDDVLEYDELSLMISTGNVEQLDNTNFTSNQGGVVLPPIQELLNGDKPKCIDSQVACYSCIWSKSKQIVIHYTL